MNSKSKSTILTLPEDLIQAVDFYAKKEGKDRTTVVIQLLRQLFGLQQIELLSLIPFISKGNPEIEHQQETSELTTRMNKLENKVTVLTDN